MINWAETHIHSFQKDINLIQWKNNIVGHENGSFYQVYFFNIGGSAIFKSKGLHEFKNQNILWIRYLAILKGAP